MDECTTSRLRIFIEGEFFSGGHLRWNLGWPTPNYAGAFLVTLLVLAFVFFRLALAPDVSGGGGQRARPTGEDLFAWCSLGLGSGPGCLV